MSHTFTSSCKIDTGNYAGDQAHINVGTGAFSTSATLETFGDGNSAAVLAPGPPLMRRTDYHFRFFIGPGLLLPLINSVILANLPAIIAYINQNHLMMKVDGLFIIINIVPQVSGEVLALR